MKEDLTQYRKIYDKYSLDEDSICENPMQLFRTWFYQVEEAGGVDEPNAMTLSTIGTDGYPKSRVVLLKRYTFEGFEFFTNYKSEKGLAIAANPRVCLSFYWPNMQRQVIVKGQADMLASNLSDGYFDSRPIGSRIGAIVSPQSQVISSRSFLEEKVRAFETDMKNEAIKRPDYWGGYLVRPSVIEFWQGRPNRLHDRIRYTLTESYHWKIERLAP